MSKVNPRKSKRNLKKAIVYFVNRKHFKCALVNRKKLKYFHSNSIGLPNVKLYYNENLIEYKNILAFYGRATLLIVLTPLMTLCTF